MPTGSYQNNKEKLDLIKTTKKSCQKRLSNGFKIFQKKKRKKREYCREHYKNLCLNMKNKG